VASATILCRCLVMWFRSSVCSDGATDHSRSPKFNLGSTIREVCVVEPVTSGSTSSTGFDKFGCECVVELSSERTS
jgi:hypothetical protein